MKNLKKLLIVTMAVFALSLVIPDVIPSSRDNVGTVEAAINEPYVSFRTEDFGSALGSTETTIGTNFHICILYGSIYSNEGYTLVAKDPNGQIVYTTSDTWVNSSYDYTKHSAYWNTSNCAPGLYSIVVTPKIYTTYNGWVESPRTATLYVILKQGGSTTSTIKLSKTKVTLKKKRSITIKVSNLAAGDYVKSWKSSNKKVATVNSKGKIKAKKKGKANITVTLASGLTAVVKVTVK